MVAQHLVRIEHLAYESGDAELYTERCFAWRHLPSLREARLRRRVSIKELVSARRPQKHRLDINEWSHLKNRQLRLAEKLRCCSRHERCDSLACAVDRRAEAQVLFCKLAEQVNTVFESKRFCDLAFLTIIPPYRIPEAQLSSFDLNTFNRGLRDALSSAGFDPRQLVGVAELSFEIVINGSNFYQPHWHLIAPLCPDLPAFLRKLFRDERAVFSEPLRDAEIVKYFCKIAEKAHRRLGDEGPRRAHSVPVVQKRELALWLDDQRVTDFLFSDAASSSWTCQPLSGAQEAVTTRIDQLLSRPAPQTHVLPPDIVMSSTPPPIPSCPETTTVNEISPTLEESEMALHPFNSPLLLDVTVTNQDGEPIAYAKHVSISLVLEPAALKTSFEAGVAAAALATGNIAYQLSPTMEMRKNTKAVPEKALSAKPMRATDNDLQVTFKAWLESQTLVELNEKHGKLQTELANLAYIRKASGDKYRYLVSKKGLEKEFGDNCLRLIKLLQESRVFYRAGGSSSGVVAVRCSGKKDVLFYRLRRKELKKII